MRSTPGRIAQACKELFNELPETAMPRLIEELENPPRVALLLRVGQNSTRGWYVTRGWAYDPESKKWVAPQMAQSHG